MGMMTDLFGTLPNATVKKSPDSVLLLSMTTPLMATWSVDEDDVLHLVIGATVVEIDLEPLTMEGLRSALSSAGLSGGSVAWNGSATLLTPGQSGQSLAGGNLLLYGYTNPLWAIIRPYERALKIARASGDTHAEQLIIAQSQGYWVDFWGSYFGVGRRTGEADASYIARIIAEVFRARNTVPAIEDGVLESLDWNIYIKEPWRRIFTLGKSRWSGRDHFQGSYYRYHIIHPLSDEAVDWSLVEEQIHLLRPAGTLIWTPQNWAPPTIIDDADLLQEVDANRYGLFQGFLDLASGRLSKSLTLSKDYLFLRILQNQHFLYHTPQNVELFYEEGGSPTWDSETWTTAAATWREKSAVLTPVLAKYQGIPDAICEFHSMAVIAGNGLWSATGYFPEIFTGDPLADREELHAAALSFGDFS